MESDAVKMAIERIKARFHPHYGIDGASDSKQLARDCQTLIAALEQAGEPVAAKVMLSLVEARRIADAIVEHCRGADFSCDMKAATKDVMRLVNVDMRLFRHQAQPGISRSQRPDLQAWQDAQSEYFDDTIIGIVTEYAEWRDAQQLAEAPLPTLQRLGQEFDAGEGLRKALEAIDLEAPANEPLSSPTVGFPPSRDPEEYDGNDIVEEAFREGVCRGLWEAAKIAREALTSPSQPDPQSRGKAFDGEGEACKPDRIKARADAIAHLTVPEDGNYKDNREYRRHFRIARDAALAAFEEVAALSSAKRGEEG